MTVNVKISPAGKEISEAVEKTIIDAVDMSPGGNIALDINSESVSGYLRDKTDLLVQLKNGETIRIVNFYGPSPTPSQLFLAEDEQLVAVDLGPAASNGVVAVSYVPQNVPSGFALSVGAAEAGVEGGGIGVGALLGGLALVGGGLALAGGGGNGNSGGGTPATTPDTVPPGAATGLTINNSGTQLTGNAEAGATARIDTNGDGQADVTAVVGADGRFTAALSPTLTNGQTVLVTIADAAGNVGPSAAIVAPDITPPLPALNVVVANDGTSVSGTAEPGSTAGVDTSGDGVPDVSVVAGTDGSFQIPLTPPLTNGETVTVIVTDPAGNSSPPATSVAPDLVPTPLAPVINPSNGAVITGTAEAGNVVTLTDGSGAVVGQVTVGPDGQWSITPATALPDGTVVTGTTTNREGDNGPPATITVDALAPAAPTINPANGETLSGTAEANSTITLTDGSGAAIGTTTTTAQGNWIFTPVTPLSDGTVVRAVSSDAAGNISGPATTVVDAVAPAAPTVDPSNGASLTGTAEAGSIVTLTDSAGNPIAQLIADSSGNWSFTPTSPITNGTVVRVIASDTAGNESPPATVTVDSVAPAAPVISPSNGTTLTGTAEANSLVSLSDGQGSPIGQVTADANGNWSFTPAAPLANGAVVQATATDATGNASTPIAIIIDAVAPAAPTVSPSNGTTLSGTAEAGATVTLTDGTGGAIGMAAVDANGNWSFSPATPLADGTSVTVTARDPAGNVSPSATVIVDAVPPAAPVIDPTNGVNIVGTAEAASTITVSIDGASVGTTTADVNGNWSFVPASQPANGAVVSATATDASGNVSAPGTVTIDTSLPSIPIIDPSNGTIISGAADAGNIVTLRESNGALLAQVTVDPNGDWTYTPPTTLPDGTVVSAVAQNGLGIDSAPAFETIDGVAPAAPAIEPSNGVELSGTAEAGATITLTDGVGGAIGTTTADANGNWTFTPPAPLPDGTVVSATATDAAGNVSIPASETIDAAAPVAPVLDASNGVVLSGTAEAGSIITLTNGTGAAIGTTTADVNGDWVFAPASPLGNGVVVNATATDAAGNTGPQGTTIIDTIAPTAPTIIPTNGVIIAGTAEANSVITLTDGSGSAIGMTMANANGSWSFTPGSPVSNGTSVTARATDAAGNSGPGATAIVDAVAPPAPTIAPSNGTVLTGTAEAGATITFADGGTVIGTTMADGAGNWSFAPVPALLDATVVSARATDAAGNTGNATTTTIDALAPIAPVITPTNGITVTGTAEAGATITLTTNTGSAIGTAMVDGNGAWSFTPTTALPDGVVVVATATDIVGNVSPQTTAVVDALAPAAPVINPTNGLILSGTAEAGSIVTLTNGGGTPLGQVFADGTGNWSLIPSAPLPDGTVVRATAADAAGNTSLLATVTVDAVAPTFPALAPTNGINITGTAEANAVISLTDGNGNVIAQVTADGSGAFSFTPTTPIANGIVILATATDASGNVSGPGATTVDAIAPALPLIAPSNGMVVSGTAEAGATIAVVNGGGVPIGTTVADINGNWSVTPSPALGDGVTVSAVATDAAGNSSGPATIIVDAIAPATPVIAPTNGVSLVGTAEALSTVSLSSGGTPIGSTTANVNGNWLFVPSPPLDNADVVNATATDAAGNVSGIGTVTVDATLPSVPIIDPSNGTIITGTADIGDTVTVTDGLGVPIGVALVDGAGNWTVTPIAPLPDGTVINAVAENAVSTDSAVATAIVDALAPNAPLIDPTNGQDVSGTTEAGATITLTDDVGGAIGVTTADANGNWSFTPGTPLADASRVNAVATDAAGNTSLIATATVDAVAPGAPVINPTNGVVLGGTAEAGCTLLLTDGVGNSLGQVTVNGGGAWTFVPNSPLPNGTIVNATATDAAGNVGPIGTATVDTIAPTAPTNLVVSADGTTLSGTAEANSQIRIVIDGDTANPVLATTNGAGTFTATFPSPVVAGQSLSVTARDAASNVSLPGFVQAPDLAPPLLAVAEATDGFVNAAEVADGIQVTVGLTVGADVGDTLSVQFVGQNGYIANQTHVISAAERLVGSVALTLTPPMGMGPYPQGASSITAAINSSTASNAVNFVVDTIRPQTPVLSLVGNILTISGEPNSELTVEVNLGGVVATVTVTADNSGLASVNLLTDLDIDPTWDQLLSASVSVRGEDQAGNPSNVATIGIGGAVDDQIVTIGNFGLNVALLPPTLGFSGRTESGSTVSVEIVTPAVTVIVAPPVDANGNFAVNLLSPAVLSQLGLTLTGLLNLGAGLSFNVVSTDSDGQESARYGVNLVGSGVGLNIGQITITGDADVDLLSGTNGRAEVINALSGDDLILNVSTGDVVNAGDGNDTIELTATNFASVNGGLGVDTILFDNGIDIDYNGSGVGTWANIERIDLGTGDSGSVLTLTSSEVDAVTDANNVLQITGEANDQLIVTGAVDSGANQTIGGLIYDVYSFGNTSLLVEQNTVVVVA